MLNSALVNSPLGQILLQANKDGLTGLYFTDQKDCPDNVILDKPEAIISKPAAGLFHNHPLAKFKLRLKTKTGQSNLFTTTNRSTKNTNTLEENAIQAELFAKFSNQHQVDDYKNIQFLETEIPKAVKKILQTTAIQLNEYWHQERTKFNLTLNPQGSDFQKSVWQALLKVELGSTLSYGGLGQQAGFGPKHGRAIGTAVGSNPISIIIPCHRILASNGTLNGYGGGLLRKAYLLQLEGFDLV